MVALALLAMLAMTGANPASCASEPAWSAPQGVVTATRSAGALAPILPPTPAGRQFLAWLAAFNSQSLPAYRDFITVHAPELAKYIRDDFQFAVLTGGFQVVRVEAGDDTSLTGLLSEPYHDVLTRFRIVVTAASPHDILALDLSGARRPADLPLPTLSERELITALSDRLEAMAATRCFSGVVLLARDDRVLFERAYGYSDAARLHRNRTGTRFGTASMSKTFTAVAIEQLARAGKSDLQAPVGRYLADYPETTIARHVTLHHLLAFVRALGTGRTVGAAALEDLTRGKVDMPNGRYANGFKDQVRDGRRYVGHGGSAPGTNGELDWYPEPGYIVVVMSNPDPPFANRVADFIGVRLPKVH